MWQVTVAEEKEKMMKAYTNSENFYPGIIQFSSICILLTTENHVAMSDLRGMVNYNTTM
jgi:hypothetical protein